MEVTDVRVRLVQSQDARLKAFCTITFDDEFVVRDLKLIDGVNGLFVAMPSRKMSGRCPKCGGKNHFKAGFCNDCGAALPKDREKQDAEAKPRFHSDIAHPITTRCRRRIQREVINVFNEEVERSKQPGYKPVELDEPDDGTFETFA
jgi:stage V sporulation protein G